MILYLYRRHPGFLKVYHKNLGNDNIFLMNVTLPDVSHRLFAAVAIVISSNVFVYKTDTLLVSFNLVQKYNKTSFNLSQQLHVSSIVIPKTFFFFLK